MRSRRDARRTTVSMFILPRLELSLFRTFWGRRARRHAKPNIETGWAEEMRYAVVFEKASSNWAAYVPDLPGCITTGGTLEGRRGVCSRKQFSSILKASSPRLPYAGTDYSYGDRGSSSRLMKFSHLNTGPRPVDGFRILPSYPPR